MTLSMEVEIVEPAADELGECPVWLESDELLRVDINAPAIILRDGAGGSDRRRGCRRRWASCCPPRTGGSSPA